MISELKKSWKLIKYGYRFKANMACGVLFILLGVIILFSARVFDETAILSGSVYLLLGPCMYIQTTQCLLFSKYVASSFQHRMLDGSFVNVSIIINCLVAYVIGIVFLACNPSLQMGSFENSGNVMISVAIVIAAIIMYYSIATKYFVVSSILFILAFGGCITLHGLLLNVASSTNIFVGSVLGLVILAVGNLLSILLRKALYKKPFSPLAGGRLRKAMQ